MPVGKKERGRKISVVIYIRKAHQVSVTLLKQ